MAETTKGKKYKRAQREWERARHGRGHFQPAISNWHSQSVGIHSLKINFEIHHAAACTHTHDSISTSNTCVCVCVVAVGAICTGLVVSEGNKYFHHAVVPFLFKMISGRH